MDSNSVHIIAMDSTEVHDLGGGGESLKQNFSEEDF